MTVMIAMPVVAFVLLMIMAVYEDHMLPRGSLPQDTPEGPPSDRREPDPRTRFTVLRDPRLTVRRHCTVRHTEPPPVLHEPATLSPAVADQPDTVPHAPPDQVTNASGEAG